MPITPTTGETPMNPLTDQQLDEYEQLANAATPGPWHLTDSGAIVAPLTQQHIADVWEPTGVSRNGEFIEAARTAVPALIDANRRLRKQVKFLLGQLAKTGAASGETERRLREFLSGEPEAETDLAAADNPTMLRWGLNDVMYGEDDTTTILLSGPNGEPYWLELDAERAAVLREDLAGPDGEETDAPEPSTRPCGHDDYHAAHEWADRPGVWCPGHRLTAAEGAAPVV